MTSSAKMQPPSKRGRPQEADPRRVSRVALRLFERRGFDPVTMDEIAEAASVSRRTLFRLFPSKSDLVWDGIEEVRDTIKARAAALPGDGLRLGVVIDELFMPILRSLNEPDAAKMARRRLRLLAGAPALLNHRTLLEIEEVIATVVAPLPLGAPPSLVARALVAAIFGALLWWAEHGEGMSALEAGRAALKVLALADGA